MNSSELDITTNRKATKYSKSELFRRVLWGLTIPLFRFSPRTFFGWRRFLLRLFGANIGEQVHIYNSACIYIPWNLEIGSQSSIGEQAYIYNLGRITIGNKTTISHRAHLCAGTHDFTNSTLPLIKLPIFISDQVWLCADSFISPGITVGEGAIVGARAVVTKDVAPWSIVAGNPAVTIKERKMKGNYCAE